MASLPTRVQINEEGPREGFQFEKGPIATARKIADKIAANPPHAVRMTKRLLREGKLHAERLNDEIVRLALSMDGTCTGEHGIGLHKMGFLVEEVGEDAIDLMRRIKRSFDPDNILNPGKIFRM